MESSKSYPIWVYRGNQPQEKADWVAVEAPLEIRINQNNNTHTFSISMRTPGQDADLALGFLFGEGVLAWDYIEAIHIERSKPNVITLHFPAELVFDWKRYQRNHYTTSSCGVCGKTALEQVFQRIPFPESPNHWTVGATMLGTLPERLRKKQDLFLRTGGNHAAGLFSRNGDLIALAEDVGRHNAMDKLVGQQLREGHIPLTNHILVLSGRASFELIQKAAMAGIRLVIAVGAPSSLAIDLADEQGITLCGFTRADRFNCYTNPARIHV
ncbi:MAG: formate dehydrogenase accessory sulfurtransferase FdhD [Bacteroidota bacterium]